MGNLTFKDIMKMFNELLAKGYTPEEIVNMPIVVGEK